jgi:ABC-type glutathione transport system ATPase component
MPVQNPNLIDDYRQNINISYSLISHDSHETENHTGKRVLAY